MSSILRRAALLAAVAGLALAPAASQGAAVKIKASATSSGFGFSPATKKVVKGTTVKWVSNSPGIFHHVAFYKKPAKSGVSNFLLSSEEPVKRVMKKVGVYKYRCTVDQHSYTADGKCFGMCGLVKVTKS